ncbi:hypothetical protein PP707_01680, partial [Acetobacter pasteurianus]|nr:hypothetical protein [Acetobacter pasteurianus]
QLNQSSPTQSNISPPTSTAQIPHVAPSMETRSPPMQQQEQSKQKQQPQTLLLMQAQSNARPMPMPMPMPIPIPQPQQPVQQSPPSILQMQPPLNSLQSLQSLQPSQHHHHHHQQQQPLYMQHTSQQPPTQHLAEPYFKQITQVQPPVSETHKIVYNHVQHQPRFPVPGILNSAPEESSFSTSAPPSVGPTMAKPLLTQSQLVLLDDIKNPVVQKKVPRKSSLSILMNTPEPETGLDTPAQVPPIPKRKTVSPPATLPKQGTFKATHERSRSILDTHAARIQHEKSISPGARARYERGIDVRGKERNSNNAMIAAAALTAAADIPFPLKSAEVMSLEQQQQQQQQQQQREQQQQQEQIADANVANESLPQVSTRPVKGLTQALDKSLSTAGSREKEKVNTDAVDIDVDVAAVAEAGEVKQNKTKKAQQEQEKQQERQKKKKTTVSTVPAAATQTTNSSSATTITTTGTSTSTSTSTTTTVGKKRKTEVPPLKTYQVDPDSGLIGCICGIEDDDGFTIQCDICFRWQHCVCMGYENGDEVPEDEYKCYYCDSEKWGKFDPLVAREKTLARLDNERIEQEEKSNETVDEIEHKSDMKKEILESGTVSAPHSISSLAANQEHVPIPPPNNKRKQLNSDKGEKKRKTDDKGNGRKSPPTVPTTPTQTAIATSGAINNTSSLVTAEHKVKFDEEAPNKNNELLEDGVTAETYQSVYYKLKENDFKRNSVKSFIVDAGVEFVNSLTELPKLEQQQLQQHQKRVSTFRGVQIMSPGQFKAIKLSRIVLPKYQKYLQDHNKLGSKKKNFNKTKVEVKPYTDNSKHKFNGISKLSLFITTTDGALVIPENTPIIEYLGEIDFFKDYCNDSINQYSLWGTTKPKVLKASIPGKEKSIDIVLDSRFVGNESRFIRKSCLSSANCKIQTIYIPELKKFKFLVVTSRPITLKAENADEELRLPWDWDSQHPILKLYENNSLEKFENLTNEEKSALITYVDNYLHFVECGCSTHSNYNNCAIFKIKKATSYLMRSTRKASSISNINLGKSKDELVLPRPDKKYVSWDERMAERDQQLQKELLEQKSVSKESENESDANIVLAELDGKDKNTEKEAAREEVIKKP